MPGERDEYISWLVFGLLSFMGWSTSGQPQPVPVETIVTIDSGAVRGVVAGPVASWKGIPYAPPPIRSLRWRNPWPVSAWPGVKDAVQFGPACMQADAAPKSEDRLTVSVWRPAAASTCPLPVMVWIHGGAMAHGGAPMYPLDAMAAQGVMAVSMNFRLGRLGYFAHPALAAEAPSAYWVSFGQSGDPNGGGRPTWPRHHSAVNRLLHFTNSGIIVGTDPLKPRLDLWQRVWERLPPP